MDEATIPAFSASWTGYLEVRRASTTFQLMSLLYEASHSIVLVEHDPMLYEDATEMVEYVSQGNEGGS